MPELRDALHALVETPPTPPAPIEAVAERAESFSRRRRLWRGTAGLALVGVGFGAVQAMGQPPNRDVFVGTQRSTSGGYVAERPGGYVARGTWRLTITRGGEILELNSDSSADCGATGVIEPGDEVRGSISGPRSRLSVGEPFSCDDTFPSR